MVQAAVYRPDGDAVLGGQHRAGRVLGDAPVEELLDAGVKFPGALNRLCGVLEGWTWRGLRSSMQLGIGQERQDGLKMQPVSA